VRAALTGAVFVSTACPLPFVFFGIGNSQRNNQAMPKWYSLKENSYGIEGFRYKPLGQK
jgi:hypothetical protein